MARGRDEADDVAAAARRGDIDPVYALCGVERALRDEALAAIRLAVLDPRTGGFNHDVFDLKETPIARVLETAQTVPMMAKRRLVVARGLDEVKAEALEPLLPYLQDPNPSTVLVLVGEKPDTRFRAFAALRKAGFLHDFKPLRDDALAGWIGTRARARSVAIDGDAVRALADAAGPDLGRLGQALEQLMLYVGESKRIRVEDVEALVADSRERSVFELTKAIGAGDPERAQRLLAAMQRNREPALRVAFMLARQIRQIWRARELGKAGTPRGEIASRIGVPPFALDEILGPARAMSDRTLERAHRRLYAADRALKSSRVDPDIQLARLVETLARDASPRAGGRPGRP